MAHIEPAAINAMTIIDDADTTIPAPIEPVAITINNAAIDLEPPIVIGEEVVPPSTVVGAPIVGLSVVAAILVAESIGATLDNAAGAITDEHIINSLKRPRPFYGPNIDPGIAFNAIGSINKGGVAEYVVSMKSVATTTKKRASPMRGGGGDSAAKKERTIDSSSMLVLKPIDYEEFLQSYLNTHPTIGYWKLLKALEQSMHVTCSKRSMQTWFDHHEPITAEPVIADYEDYLS